MNTHISLAADRSARHVDTDGRLHIDRSHISKAVINPYYGKEIPSSQQLGLDPDKIYYLYRDPVELERGAHTFARLPVLMGHVPRVTADELPADKIVGSIGSDVAFNAPYLDADICIWDAAAIAGIDTDTIRELSCGYHYDPVMQPGEVDGQHYDGVMTNIRGNHLALVEVGRAGSDVVVADHNPFTKEAATMKTTKLGKALITTLCAISPVLAADSAMPVLLGGATRKTFKRADVVSKLLAADATLDPQQLDRVIDALLDVEQDPVAVEPMTTAAADESPEGKLRALLAGKVEDAVIDEACALMAPAAAVDEDVDDDKPMDKEEVKAAMDAYGKKLRDELRDAEQARRDVQPVVGNMLGQDSAADIYRFALAHMKIAHDGVNELPALKALFNVANSKAAAPVRMAADSVSMVEQFPGAARFRTV